ncbi:MAG: hypothetical protein WC813_04250 [Patescibacteria group bacterium]|jgi:hypothetical protein
MNRTNAIARLKGNALMVVSLSVGFMGLCVGGGGLMLAARTTRELHALEYRVQNDLGDPDATRLGKFAQVPVFDADGKPVMIPCPGQPGARCTKTHRLRQSAWEEMESLDGRIHKIASELETHRLYSDFEFRRIARERSDETTDQWREQVDTLLATNPPAEVVADDSDPPAIIEGALDGDVLPGDPGFDAQVSEFCPQNPEKHADGKFYLTGCTEGGTAYVHTTFVCNIWDSTPPYLHGCDIVR